METLRLPDGGNMGFLWIGAAAFLLILLQEAVYHKYWDRGLSARLQFAQPSVREGEIGALKEVVENRKRMPLPVLHVNLQLDRSLVFDNQENTAVSDQTYRRDVFAVLPYQQITRTLSFTASKRGYYQCREVELVGRTLFFHGPFVKRLPQQAALYVYPKAIPAEPVQAACREMLGEYLWKKRLFEDPFSFQGIRDYQPQDSFRQVNWKAYGRTGQLKVNVYEHTAMARADILLNLQGDSIWTEEILLEGVIRIGAALAENWIALGVPTGIRTNGRDPIYGGLITVRSGAGTAHIRTILEALSRIDLKLVGFDWERGEGSRGNTAGSHLSRDMPEGSQGDSSPGTSAESRSHWCAPPQTRIDEELTWMAGWENGVPGGMILYVSCSQRESDLRQIEELRQRGAQVLWIRPVILRMDEDEKRALWREGIAMREEAEESTGWEACSYRGPVLKWRVDQ